MLLCTSLVCIINQKLIELLSLETKQKDIVMSDNSGSRQNEEQANAFFIFCYQRDVAKVTPTPAVLVFVTKNINATSLPTGLLYIVKKIRSHHNEVSSSTKKLWLKMCRYNWFVC